MLACMVILPTFAHWKTRHDQARRERAYLAAFNDPKDPLTVERLVEAFAAPEDTLPPLPASVLSTLGVPELCAISQQFGAGFVVETLSFPYFLVVDEVVVVSGEAALCGYSAGKLRWKLGGSADQEFLGTDGTDIFTTWDGSPTYARVDPQTGLVTGRSNTLPSGVVSPETAQRVSVADLTLTHSANALQGVYTLQFRSTCLDIDVTTLNETEIATDGSWVFLAHSELGLFIGLDTLKSEQIPKILRSAYPSEDVAVSKRC